MCKFCDLTILDEEADIHRASLILDLEVKLGDGEYTLKNKEVNIKYCPFCGKEL